MIDLADLVWGRLTGGAQAPIGTFVNLRTMTYFQQVSDGTLPVAGWWYLVGTSATLTASQIATAVNSALGTAYTSANFSAYSASNAMPYPGTGCSDG
jgi:ABC-type Mn2+/Zn2+ transport system permease subunit